MYCSTRFTSPQVPGDPLELLPGARWHWRKDAGTSRVYIALHSRSLVLGAVGACGAPAGSSESKEEGYYCSIISRVNVSPQSGGRREPVLPILTSSY